ncbi:TonB-dependent receptor plug domain-containing protein [Nisaea sp.]|uniref:TonB-dependent receptor plug domain-containing protein n=1 Tax=Nisaea sp. TaxID=2024842 RepID=UPI003B528F21
MDFFAAIRNAGFWTAFLSTLAITGPARSAEIDPISRMSLEYLMNMEVTTVSKQPERIQNAAAAVSVLTREEIQRSGATTLPDALRLVPGVNVARINANSWAVSIRGFNSRFANKLLVMIDGRSIYSPLFSGVFWDRYNVPISDIDRIEVVRGPGGTLWGANAVNGVINIITRHSSETQNTRAELSVGTERLGDVFLSQGSALSKDATYRLSGNFSSYAASDLPDGSDAGDDWYNGQANLRVDWTPTGMDELLIESGVNQVTAAGKQTAPSLSAPYSETRDGEIDRHGLYLNGKWTRQLSATSNFSLQGFLDYRYMDLEAPDLGERRTTADAQFQHNSRVASEIDLTWGGGYRAIFSDLESEYELEIDPEDETFHIYNAFAQASRGFFDDRVELTIGSKIEHHSQSGSEVQPSVRGLWNVTPRHALWGAVSTAARTPGIESNATVRNLVVPPGTPNNPSALPLTPSVQGNPELDAERVTAYEIGYHGRLLDELSVDIAGFVNEYDNLLLSSDAGEVAVRTASGIAYIDSPVVINNQAEARTFGMEVSGVWEPMSSWRLRASYSWLHEDIEAPAGAEGNAPEHQAALQSFYDIDEEWRFDSVLRFVDELSNVGADAYVNLDARLSWQPRAGLEIALTGRNLIDSGYLEYGVERPVSPIPQASETARSVMLSVAAKF